MRCSFDIPCGRLFSLWRIQKKGRLCALVPIGTANELDVGEWPVYTEGKHPTVAWLLSRSAVDGTPWTTSDVKSP
jgi:hypothetical protein